VRLPGELFLAIFPLSKKEPDGMVAEQSMDFMQEQRFAMMGVAGYVAPRHLQAIRALGHRLTVAYDPFDSVGILDRYFPETCFSTDFDRFDAAVRGGAADWLGVCTPNHLHFPHVAYGLERGMDVICEKPLGLEPAELEEMTRLEERTGRRVRTILQLRYHPEILRLKERVAQAPQDRIHDIDLTYITPRGRWYAASWKGDAARSGGVATNIGVHFYDMLHWIFGELERSVVHRASPGSVAGFLQLRRARVRYFLSIDPACCPPQAPMTAYRKLEIDGEEFVFSDGFTDLHTECYRDILAGGGYGPADARAAIATLAGIRRATPVGPVGDCHPWALRMA